MPLYDDQGRCESHSRCTASMVRQYWQPGQAQAISLSSLRSTLQHKVQHMRADDTCLIFDGTRCNKVRALQPINVSSRLRPSDGLPDGSGFTSAFFHPHPEFVGQGRWRGPYPHA